MRSRSCCNRAARRREIKMKTAKVAAMLCVASALVCARSAKADAPAWMHSLIGVPVPAHDDKTDAVILYSEEIVTVQAADKIRRTVRTAYKILRPSGREHGLVMVTFNQHRKVTSMRGWCIPAQGKDYEVKEKDAFEISLPK